MPSYPPSVPTTPFDELVRHTDLKEQIKCLEKDELMQAGKQAFTLALQACDFTDPIYQDDNYPMYALLALSENHITIEQFTSTMLRWSAFKDYPKSADRVETIKLSADDLVSQHKLKPFLVIEKDTKEVAMAAQDNMRPEEFQDFIQKMSTNPEIPESEKYFTVLHLKQCAELEPILYRFEELGFSLFMPRASSPEISERYYQLIIPSQTIIQETLSCIGEPQNHIRLVPRIGEDSGDDVYQFHKRKQHPMGLSFPGFERSEADGFGAGCFGFSLHDIYHTTLLKFLNNLPILNQMVETFQTFSEDCDEQDDKHIAETNAFFFIDGEFRQHLTSQRTKLGTLYPSIFRTQEFNQLFALALSLWFQKGIEDSQVPSATAADEKRETQDSKTITLLKEQIRYLFKDMLTHPDKWAVLGIQLSTLIDLIFDKGQVITRLLREIEKERSQAYGFGRSSFDDLMIAVKNTVMLFKETLAELQIHLEDTPFLKKRFALEEQVRELLQDNKMPELLALLDTEDFKIHLDNLNFPPLFSKTPLLLLCIESGASESISVLARQGLNLDTVLDTDTGDTALHMATRKSHTKQVSALLEAGANLHKQNKQHQHAIDIAIQAGDNATLLVFLQAGVSPSFKYLRLLESEGAIHQDCQALIEAYIAFKENLKKALDHVDAIEKIQALRDLKKHNPHQFPCTQMQEFNPYRETHLDTYDKRPMELDRYTYRPMLFNLKNQLEFDEFIKGEAHFDPNQNDAKGNTLLMSLVKQDDSYDEGAHQFLFNQLMRYDLDLKHENHKGETVFDIALSLGKLAYVGKLLSRLPSLLQNNEKTVLSVQQLFASGLSHDTVKLLSVLIEHGLELNIPLLVQKKPSSSMLAGAFGIASSETTIQSLWSLLRHSPIWVARSSGLFSFNGAITLEGHVDAPLHLRKLCLLHGADPNQPNYDGKPEMLEAIEKGWYEYACLLIEKSYDVNQEDEAGLTALHYAAKASKPQFIELLLRHHALCLTDKAGKRPTDYLDKKDAGTQEQVQACRALLGAYIPTKEVGVQTDTMSEEDDDLGVNSSYGAAL